MDFIVSLKKEEGVLELVERARIERVEAVRPLDGENGDSRLAFDVQVVKGHVARPAGP